MIFQNQHVHDLKVAVSAILRDLCQGCDVYPENFEKTNLNCSTSGHVAYFSTALVYSNSDGTIVASTLINMLLSWLLSEDTSRITVGVSSFSLSKKCPTPLNTITMSTCINLFNSDTVRAEQCPTPLNTITMSTCIDLFNSYTVGAVSSDENIPISLSVGMITGIIICITVIAIIIW